MQSWVFVSLAELPDKSVKLPVSAMNAVLAEDPQIAKF
jgi:hypothetical protein